MPPISHEAAVPGSFRDPSGFLFFREGVLYRQVNRCYAADYDALMTGGLYERFVSEGLLISHEETDAEAPLPGVYKIIRPTEVGFISYPYEWSFSQLRDAALLTLRVQAEALERGMVLKDASGYNVQFHEGRPVFIDTLSFERYVEGKPWAAYRQFVQHFLAPLALMSKVDVSLNQLQRTNIDGVPLALASKLLPRRTRWNFALLTHVHLLAKSQKRHADDAPAEAKRVAQRKVSKLALRAIVDSLRGAVARLSWKPGGTEWSDYYDATNYSDAAMKHKHELVAQCVDRVQPRPRSTWDLGANTGSFSRIAARRGIATVAFDIDPAAVEKNYLHVKQQKEAHVLPLVMDLTNPSPAIGWRNRERQSLIERGPVDLVMALALVHHLAISNNVPLGDLAAFFAEICEHLIVEFVPKSDSQVRRLLATRQDIFPDYTIDGFEAAFSTRFEVLTREPVRESDRVLYLMKRMSL